MYRLQVTIEVVGGLGLQGVVDPRLWVWRLTGLREGNGEGDVMRSGGGKRAD